MLLFWLIACATHVNVVIVLVGAFVTQGRERLGAAPQTVTTNIFGTRRVTVRLAGYRTVEMRITRRMADAGTVEVRLVPEHGGAGTWSSEEVP